MTVELMVLGGAEEIGANSCYLNIEGTGIIIDAGLHPRRRDRLALPRFELLADKATDALLVTHAHTDHIGGLPYAMHQTPHVRVLMTRATRDLAEIMLRNSSKLLRSDVVSEFPAEALSQYNRAILRKLSLIFEGLRYREECRLQGKWGHAPITLQMFDAAHILGSAGILMETERLRIFHSGDVNFSQQALLPGADFPRQHLDALILESTNGADEEPPERSTEIARLAEIINAASDANGSVLIPAFALGKTQEVIKLIYELMRAGRIPRLPLYTGGMSRNINAIYDRYCYAVPRPEPGFEISDIPQIAIDYDNLLSDEYFRRPAIVVASSGMLNARTTAFQLAEKWLRAPNYAIVFAGYLDPDSPGYALAQSEAGRPFMMAGKSMTRRCRVEQLRFTSHARREHLVDFVWTTKPKHVFLVHGDADACETLGAEIKKRLPQTKVYIPKLGRSYFMEF